MLMIESWFFSNCGNSLIFYISYEGSFDKSKSQNPKLTVLLYFINFF